jgi:hypothetical protein
MTYHMPGHVLNLFQYLYPTITCKIPLRYGVMKPFALTLDPKPFALKRLSPLVCIYITLKYPHRVPRYW